MKRTIRMMPAIVLFAVYMYALVKIILFKFGQVDLLFLWQRADAALDDVSRLHYRLHSANLVPLRTITGNLRSRSLYEYIQFYGNIGLFIPLGLFVPYFMRGRLPALLVYGAAIILSFALCLMLESAQLLCSIGQFDVDDLILNTAGGLLGCILYHLLAGTARSRKPAAALG
ncbi:VanZ family protein [Paenibacillus xylaniclasticus]|uniref:VanZ family protein n=1 Tax=Paenibacillus xylaniclasticus TaxID=588083 RepID=UPI0013DFC484|nr:MULTISPECIES: VanZ family protein [Paenibacillus]